MTKVNDIPIIVFLQVPVKSFFKNCDIFFQKTNLFDSFLQFEETGHAKTIENCKHDAPVVQRPLGYPSRFCGGRVLWGMRFVGDAFCGGCVLWGMRFVGDAFCGGCVLWGMRFAGDFCKSPPRPLKTFGAGEICANIVPLSYRDPLGYASRPARYALGFRLRPAASAQDDARGGARGKCEHSASVV